MRTRLLVSAMSLALGAACPPDTNNKTTVVLGAVLDRTGINSELSWGDAVALAQAHVNMALDEAGYKNMAFKILIRDSAGLADAAVEEATKLVKNDGAKGLLLATSDEDLAVHKLSYDADSGNDLGVPLVCASCTSSSINSPSANSSDAVAQAAWRNSEHWNFRGIMSTKLVAKVLASLVVGDSDKNHDGKVKVSFYGVNDSFGTGAKKDLDAELKTQLDGGAPYVLEELFHPREIDTNSYNWAQDVSKLLDDRNETTSAVDGFPDTVVSANLVLQESAFTKAYVESGTSIRVLHFQTFRTSSALRPIAQLAEGQEGVSHVLYEANDDSGKTFKREFESAIGQSIVYRDAIYYDTAMMLMLGVLKATIHLDDPTTVTGSQIRNALVSMGPPIQGKTVSSGKDGVRAALEELKNDLPINYQGASGPMDWDANFNVTDKLAHFRVRDGQFVDVDVYNCVRDSSCPKDP